MKSIIFICLFLMGCQSKFPKDECDILARKYNANVITIRDKNVYTGYARILNKENIWKSSKDSKTKTVEAGNIWKLKLAIADEMREGVEKNSNLPDDNDSENLF